MKINLQALKKMLNRKKNRPILEGIHYKDNYFEFTNSFELIRVYTNHKSANDFTLDINTLKYLEGIYPSIDNIINESTKQSYPVDTTDYFIRDKEIYFIVNNNDEIVFNQRVVLDTLRVVGLHKDYDELISKKLRVNKYGSGIYLHTDDYFILIMGIKNPNSQVDE